MEPEVTILDQSSRTLQNTPNTLDLQNFLALVHSMVHEGGERGEGKFWISMVPTSLFSFSRDAVLRIHISQFLRRRFGLLLLIIYIVSRDLATLQRISLKTTL